MQSLLKLKKINLITEGAHVEKVIKTDLFVMDHIKVQKFYTTGIQYADQKLKKCFFVLVNKLTISHFVMDHIIKNNKG